MTITFKETPPHYAITKIKSTTSLLIAQAAGMVTPMNLKLNVIVALFVVMMRTQLVMIPSGWETKRQFGRKDILD